MPETDTDCQALLEEFQELSRRLEESDFTNPDVDDTPEGSIDPADIERLQEIKTILEEECDTELPDELEDDLDIPEWAGNSPSEPMEFDKEE